MDSPEQGDGSERSTVDARGLAVAGVGDVPALVDRRYRIEQLVGAGGMGTVFRARDLELDEVVALKVLRSETAARIGSLRREVVLARRVTHRNVVRVHHLGVEPGGRVYLTMEHIDGVSLRQLLETAVPGPEEAARLAIDICRGIEAAHEAGVVHSDLKPGNVLCRHRSGRFESVLADFGIARALSESSAWIAGTPAYMAPEQRRGETIDARADLFALAAVVFELLTGDRLLSADGEAFAGGPIAAQLQRVPEPLASILAAALEDDPRRRPASAAEIRAALASLTPGAVPPPRRPPPAPLAGPRLAVATLATRGSPERGYLGVGVAEELIRILSRLPGLQVLGGGALAAAADPIAAAAGLGASAVLTGAITAAGDRVRVATSLIEPRTGLQLWAGRFDGALAELLVFQEQAAARIAEALRVEWAVLESSATPVSAEATDLYLRARRQLRAAAVVGPGGALEVIERCLELEPELAVAVALRAIACCKAWFLPSAAGDRDWAASSGAAVADALARAPDLAESHLAAGIDAAQRGDYDAAGRYLERSLELAPTAPETRGYLGRLLAEAGRQGAARENLELALALDPSLIPPRLYLARDRALDGDPSGAAELHRVRGHLGPAARVLALRIALWRSDEAELRRTVQIATGAAVLPDETASAVFAARYALGDIDPETADAVFAARVPETLSPRVRSNLRQPMIECHLIRGQRDRALAHLERAAADALLDADWMARCPLLTPLRTDPRFLAAERRIGQRAAALWTLAL